MGNGIISYLIADAIVQVIHEATFVDGQHLVECPSDMKTERITCIFHAAADFLTCEVAAVGCPKVEFVTIFIRLDGAKDGPELYAIHLASARVGEGEVPYAGELVKDLSLLRLQLLGVG